MIIRCKGKREAGAGGTWKMPGDLIILQTMRWKHLLFCRASSLSSLKEKGAHKVTVIGNSMIIIRALYTLV